jgi:hypothetical protein
MKRGLLLTLGGLAIGFVLPTLAQQSDTADPQIREQIVALFGKFTEAWNNNDAAALAALYTKDAIFVVRNTLLREQLFFSKIYQFYQR